MPAAARTTDRQVTPPVAGTIAPEGSPLAALVSDWLDYLARNGRSDRTAATWRAMIRRDCNDLGVFHPDQITYATIAGGLDRLREQHGWSASTLRCHLSAWKSLDRHRRRVDAGDLQAAVGPTDTEPGDGSRAATLGEARGLLGVALDMEANDRRSRSARTLYWLCMFLAGCREEDHWHWRWDEHIRLDAPVPHIRWTRGIQKNKRTMHVALAPELADALRAHREAMRRLASAAGRISGASPAHLRHNSGATDSHAVYPAPAHGADRVDGTPRESRHPGLSRVHRQAAARRLPQGPGAGRYPVPRRPGAHLLAPLRPQVVQDGNGRRRRPD